MAENIEENSPKKRPKCWLLALCLIPVLCLLCYLEVATAGDRYYKHLDKQAPRPTEIVFSDPKMITSALSDCTYDLSWSDKKALWLWDCKNDDAITVDIDLKKVVHEKPATANNEEPYIKIFEPNGKNKLIAQCPEENLTVRGGSIKKGENEIALWKGEKMITSFLFSSPQWKDFDGTPDSYAAFSPNCAYFYLVLYGDFDVESFAAKELWLLDVRNKSFKLAFTGRQEESYALFDLPVQYVEPSWSPDNQEFVFGDSRFGIEVYNVITGERRIIAGPSSKLDSPQWSPASQWIAAIKYGESGFTNSRGDGFLVVISPDGKEIALSPGCSLIDDFAWSPDGKQLAYTCTDFFESSNEELASPCPEEEQFDCSCYGSDSSHETNSLWVWEIEK